MVETFPTQLLRSPIKAFIDDEFSDCEINILQDIVDRYGRYTDKELVEILGRKMAYEFQILVYRLVMRRSDGSFGELGWFQALS